MKGSSLPLTQTRSNSALETTAATLERRVAASEISARTVRTMHRRGRRSGFALVQIVGLVTVTGLVLSLTAAILGFAFKANKTSMQSLRQEIVLRSLERRLRSDCHRATQVTLSNTGALELRVGQRRVSYQLVDNLVVRSSGLADDPIGDVFNAADEWRLPGKNTASLTCQIERSGTCPLVAVAIELEGESRWAPIQWKIRSGIHE